MLRIQILGKGLIPRGMGLAPKKTPFPADLNLIRTIISTPGLKVNYINPLTGALSPITRENCQRTWDLHNSKNGKFLLAPGETPVEKQSSGTPVVEPVKPAAPTNVQPPVVVVPPVVPPVVVPPVVNTPVTPPVATPPIPTPIINTEKPVTPVTPPVVEPVKPVENSGGLKPINRPDDKDLKPAQTDNSKK